MLSGFAREVGSTIKKYGMLEPADRVLVGVSGGADSVALLLALSELNYTVAVAHLNHSLRGADSDEDATFVEALANRLAVPHFTRRVAFSSDDGNIEASGRAARREFFNHILRESSFDKIALAHNQNDRVETFLLHLVRGAGMEGLVSMAPVTGQIIRPLTETDRTSIEE